MEDEFELELDVRKGKYLNLSTIHLFGFKQFVGPGCLFQIPDPVSKNSNKRDG